MRIVLDDRPGKQKLSVLSESMNLYGVLSGEERMVLNGHFRGTIDLKSELLIAATAFVEANIFADTVIVYGRVLGDMVGLASICIKNGGVVEGNILAPEIVLENGARVTGTVMIGDRN